MYLPEKQIYRFAGVEVDLARECLTLNGEERHLRQKAFQVLVYLLKRRGRVVSKGELFDSVWQDTAVTDDVLVQCVTEIRRAVGDHTHNPQFIKTVPKSGYRFIGQVEEKTNGHFSEEITRYEVEIEEEIETRLDQSGDTRLVLPSSFRSSRANLFAAFAIAVFAALLYIAWPTGSGTANVAISVPEGRKAVAVMFFDNQSKSTDFDWLREGLADMMSAGLSRSDKLTVLSRGQLHTLLERSGTANTNVSVENAADIARQSRAEFIVSGSFAQIDETIRLDVRLHDGKTGSLMTTESLTVEKASQLLTEIDLLSLKISNRLNAAPVENRDMASVMTDNLEAYRYYSLGVEKAQAFQTIEAVDLLQKAVALDPEFAMAHARIGYAYAVTSGQLDKGKPYLEKAFQLSSRLTEKDRMNIAAWYAIANQDFEMAVRSYREIIQRFPFEIEAYVRLARLLKGEEKFDEAIEVLRHGATIDADAKDIYNSLGAILSGQGKQAEAITAHERYVALAPTEPNAYDSLGLTFQWSGDYAKAIENFNRAVELEPKFEIGIIHLANAQLMSGKYNESIASFNRYIDAVATDVEKKRGYDGITLVYLQKGDLSLAAKFSARSSKIKEDLFSYEYLISVRRGDAVKAQRLEKTILSGLTFAGRGSRPSPRFELYYRGLIALNNGRNDEAIAYFRQTITHPPPTWHQQDFEDCLADALLKLGRFDEAITEYQRILQLNPHYPRAHFHLGQAYASKGEAEQARVSYQTFLDVWKNADADIPEVVSANTFLNARS